MYISGTLLDLKYWRNCFAPSGKCRVVGMDTMTYDFWVLGDFDTPDQAKKSAVELSGNYIVCQEFGQTQNKAYIFNDRGEAVGEAGCF